ncbi:UPF0496 protein At1g20180 [Quercus robur]|uniref:UPF0496 protein At1g20180 n=1 Tax=Quercus robur TaxID=38942 RepID=UPI0021622F80|nr:UPF0496 protein At1g20180 [Quercus robur]
MSQMRKSIRWPKLKSPFRRAGRSPIEDADSLSSVNDEYMEAFRTKSYTDMWDKVHDQLESTSMKRPSSSTSLSLHTHLSQSLLEPRQETLADMIQGMDLHYLLIDYFKASLEACKICETLLQSVHQTHANYRKIKRVIKLSRSVHDSADYTDDQCQVIFGKLAAFASMKNPLSIISPEQFRETRDGYMVLLQRLTSKHRKIKRNVRFGKIWKKVGGVALVMSHSAILILLLLFALHSIVGIVAAPALLACSLGLCTKKMKGAWGGLKAKVLGKLGDQIDVAAKGVYILVNDFDTMSRMVKRLHDEVEHRKAVADICVKSGKFEILKEVVRDLHVHESSFQEQLEELEEHIYLCFLTINRSRRLVIQEIMVAHH